MIFYLLIIATLAWIIIWNVRITIRRRQGRDYGDIGRLGASTLPLGVLAMASLMFFATVASIGSRTANPELDRVESTIELRALNTGSEISGSFFLGSGTVDEKRMLFFVATRDGYSYLDEARADRSRIIETNETPRVEKMSTWVDSWIIAPFPVLSMGRYDFYVPPGSVLEDFRVTP